MEKQQKKTCDGCEHYAKGWCKRFAAIIHKGEPVTRCEKRGAK